MVMASPIIQQLDISIVPDNESDSNITTSQQEQEQEQQQQWKNGYVGSVTGADGCVYGIPSKASQIIKFNPTEQTTTLLGEKNIFHGYQGYKWAGGVLGQDNCVYGCPYDEDQVLKFNPDASPDKFKIEFIGERRKRHEDEMDPKEEERKVEEQRLVHDEREEEKGNMKAKLLLCCFGRHVDTSCYQKSKRNHYTHDYDEKRCKYRSAVSYQDRIYFIPFNAKRILRCDCNNDVKKSKLSHVGKSYEGKFKWDGGCVSDIDDCIYFVPYCHGYVLRLDPSNDSTTLVGNYFPGYNKWTSCVTRPDGAIFCPPNSANQFLKIQITKNETSTSTAITKTGSTSSSTSSSSTCKTSCVGEVKQNVSGWGGCTLCTSVNNDFLFMIPYCANRIEAFNMTDEESYDIGPLIEPHKGVKYMYPSISTKDNCLYGIPYNSNHIIKMDIPLFSSVIKSFVDHNPRKDDFKRNTWIGKCIPESAFTKNEGNATFLCNILKETSDGKSLLYEWVNDPSKATLLFELIKTDWRIVKVTDKDGKRVIDIAVPECKQSMEASLLEVALQMYSQGDEKVYTDMIKSNSLIVQPSVAKIIDKKDMDVTPLFKILKETEYGKNFILTSVLKESSADFIFKVVQCDRSIAYIKDEKDRQAIDIAVPMVKEMMKKALLLFGKFDVSGDSPLHSSLTACVLKATYLDQEKEDKHESEEEKDVDEMRESKKDADEAKVVKYADLKCIREYDQAYAELNGRAKLKKDDLIMKVRMVYIDSSVDDKQQKKLKDAGKACHVDVHVKDTLESELSYIVGQRRSKLLQNGSTNSKESFKFLLEFDYADRTLVDALRHEKVFNNIFEVKNILQQIIKGVSHLHKNDIIHADLKPLNIVYDQSWKLINLDVSCAVGEGNLKRAECISSGYCPPEVASIIFNAKEKSNLKSYEADKSYDIWSIGVLMYHLCSGSSLFHVNEDGNISTASEKIFLQNWDPAAFIKCTNLNSEFSQAQKLLEKLLEPKAKGRLNFFDGDVLSILEDPFFKSSEPKKRSTIDLADNQFLANCQAIDLPSSGTVAQDIAKDVCDLVLFGARDGAGERQECKGMIVIVGSKEQYEKYGYIQGTNKFEGKDIYVKDWKKNQEFVLTCFLQDLGLFVEGTTGKILADHYKVDLYTRDADHNGGSKHVSASAIGMKGCLAIKCSEDCCMSNGRGKGELKVFPGTKLPVSVDVKPNANYED